MTFAPTSRATSTTSTDIETIRTEPTCARDSATIASRSHRRRSGSPFSGFVTTATTSSSNSLEARSATLEVPVVERVERAREQSDGHTVSFSVVLGS